MKIRYALVGLSLLAVQATCFGGARYGAAGCGLGSLVIGSDPGYGQVFAATTNGSSYSQTFGITSGTSNCIPMSHEAAFNQQKHFVDSNLASLASEMAQGNGEMIVAFSQTFGCADSQAAAKAMQAGHGKIFQQGSTDNIVFATHDVLKADPATAATCKNLI